MSLFLDYEKPCFKMFSLIRERMLNASQILIDQAMDDTLVVQVVVLILDM